MQEEVNQKTVALVIRAGKLTAENLQRAMRAYINHLKQKRTGKEEKHGKTTVKKLLGKDQGASTLGVGEDGIRSFNKVARKYNVDFAVKKDKTEDPPKYIVFFKGRDQDVITQAFKEYMSYKEKKAEKPSLRNLLSKFKEKVDVTKQQDRNRERVKSRSQSL